MRSRKPVASAAFPFSLLITGVLKPEERERLVDLLSREGVGISELDLEPQFTAARILIPRISEYAGVVIIQAMRSAQVRMMLGPSDSIFATDETRASPDELQESRDQAGASPASVSQVVGDTNHPAESIIVTPDENIRGMKNHEILDTLTASATMKAKVVESENSAAFQDLLENLKRELKYKAYRKGAQGIVHFSVQLMPLQMTASYRVTVMGAAVRPAPAPGEAQATPQQKVRLPSA
jgi:uncharacterized protein YbjQ (UPF0145 family)